MYEMAVQIIFVMVKSLETSTKVISVERFSRIASVYVPMITIMPGNFSDLRLQSMSDSSHGIVYFALQISHRLPCQVPEVACGALERSHEYLDRSHAYE